MYESYTYEFLLGRMLERVPNNIDKREGSIIYDACAPAAAELAQMYIELNLNSNLSFADTATDEYLSRKTSEFGIDREPATYALRRGEFRNASDSLMDVPLNSRFGIDDLTYIVTSKISLGVFVLTCESTGIVGNQSFGTLLPITFVAGLVSANLLDVLIPGEDVESDGALRSRFYSQVQSPGLSGNIADYEAWALSVEGVGNVQVQPLWSGAGTVKVVIVNSEGLPASGLLVSNVQDFISPIPSSTGEGVAPIGAHVTVISATGVAISVSATVVLSGSATIAEINAVFSDSLKAYLRSIAFASDPSPKYARIGSLLLDTPGVLDFSVLRVNGGTTNIAIALGQVAIGGTVTLSG
ncbi:baseplate J/gp47 family protein [Paenibacillus sinopodophylli]|uniref:baseplate J/gp47 family protein n=1 Tax=Paenibacillus sinopodophylli TaxID=1837342 RepID=UPI00110D1EA1|nr:baseplate J/gp47 family protein [Paenibacillus sinopodophylli]